MSAAYWQVPLHISSDHFNLLLYVISHGLS